MRSIRLVHNTRYLSSIQQAGAVPLNSLSASCLHSSQLSSTQALPVTLPTSSTSPALLCRRHISSQSFSPNQLSPFTSHHLLHGIQPRLGMAPRRCFASITTTNTTAEQFEYESESFLETLQNLLESSRFDPLQLDITLSDGVLNVSSRTKGTWVLNRHGPTRQLWLSSPLSGPAKFNWHEDEVGERIGDGWKGERDLTRELKKQLVEEWKEAFGMEIDMEKEFPMAQRE